MDGIAANGEKLCQLLYARDFETFLIFSVIGALIGKQKSRNIEIMNSFELVFNVIGGDIVIDRDYYNTKEEQCKFYLALSLAVYVF